MIRHNSPVLVVVWPWGKIEVTQVTAELHQQELKDLGCRVELIKVQGHRLDLTPGTGKI